MNLADFLLKATGQFDRFETAMAKLDSSLASAQAKDLEIASLKDQLATASAPTDLSDLQGQISTLTKERDDHKTRADKAEKDLLDEQAAFPEKLNTEVARVIAANGHEPVDTISTKKDDGKKPESNLTGYAKVANFFKQKESK